MDPTGPVHATGNQVPSPPDAGHDRLSLRRLEGVLVGRLDQASADVPGDGGAGRGAAIDALRPFQNPVAPKLRTTREDSGEAERCALGGHPKLANAGHFKTGQREN